MASPAPEIRRIIPEAVKALMDEMQAMNLVDVRDPADYFSSPLTILGAISIAPDRFSEAADEIPRGQPTIVFGTDPEDPSGPRCAHLLQQRGYSDVFVLDGGWNGWIARDYPTMPRDP